MDLPNLLNKLKNTSEEARKFFAIEIGLDSVKTAVWQSTGVHTEIVSVGSLQRVFSTSLDDLITAIDTSLSDALVDVGNEPNQVIFGLPETWADGDGIVEGKKGTLKAICQKLGLRPIGFVVTTEAMAHHLRDIEGSPPSAFIVRLSASMVSVHLLYLGKLETSQLVERSSSVVADVEEGIARVPHVGHLPSRMLLISDDEDVESIKQDFISYDWQKRLEFVHIPKIETLSKDWSIRAVALSGGGEVVAALGLQRLQEPAPEKVALEPKPSMMETIKKDEKPSHFGFTAVVVEDEPEPESVLDSPKVEMENAAVLPANMQETVEEVEEKEMDVVKNLAESAELQQIDSPKREPLLLGFKQKMQRVTLPKFSRAKLLVPLVIVLIIGLTAGGLFYGYTTYARATVDVSVRIIPYQQQLSFTVDPSIASASMESLIIPGKKETLEKQSTQSMSTTGSKTVGDRARGKVTLYNRTTSSKTFQAGTSLKSGSLKFTLDTTVTVASASSKENADYSIVTEPSKVEALITAAEIGEQYNLNKDSQFSVSTYSSDNFIAVATTAISGGSSRKVPAASKEDLANLKKLAMADLKTQFEQVNGDGLMVGEPEIVKEEYSAKSGEEANSISLTMVMSQSMYVYDLNEVTLMAQQAAQRSMPSNARIKPGSSKIQVLESSVNENGAVAVKADLSVEYIPEVDIALYKQQLVNKPLSSVDEVLRVIPNYSNNSITPHFLWLQRMPPSAESIDIKVMPVTQ